jgi:hypothetical protein
VADNEGDALGFDLLGRKIVAIARAVKDGVRGFVDEGFQHLGSVTRVDDDDRAGPGLKPAVGAMRSLASRVRISIERTDLLCSVRTTSWSVSMAGSKGSGAVISPVSFGGSSRGSPSV